MKPLEQEYHFYHAHHDELVREYAGKYLVIRETTVVGAYDKELDAVQDALRQGLEPGKFCVQKCEPEEEIHTFHSRVSFDYAGSCRPTANIDG